MNVRYPPIRRPASARDETRIIRAKGFMGCAFGAVCSTSILFTTSGIERCGEGDSIFLRKLSRYDEFTHVDFRLYDGCRHKFTIHDDS